MRDFLLGKICRVLEGFALFRHSINDVYFAPEVQILVQEVKVHAIEPYAVSDRLSALLEKVEQLLASVILLLHDILKPLFVACEGDHLAVFCLGDAIHIEYNILGLLVSGLYHEFEGLVAHFAYLIEIFIQRWIVA